MAPRLAEPSRGASAGSAGARRSARPGSASGTRATPGTYYAGLETVPASLAGVLVYLYPAIVAVLSIRYATRLAGRRPWIALGIALRRRGPRPRRHRARPAAARRAGILLILASPVIYAGWIILSARLAGERTDRLAHETRGDGRPATPRRPPR